MSDNLQTPSLKEMVYSLNETLQAMLKTAIEKKVVLLSEEKARARLDICLACEFFMVQPEGSIVPARCSRCGCGMKIKARMAAAKCPIDKWGPVTD